MQRRIQFQRDFQVVKGPPQAPAKIVRQVESPRMAMRTMLKAGKLKLLPVATQLGISESYLSRIVNEREPMPEWFADKFCAACNSALLTQYLALADFEAEAQDTARWLERKLANELRMVAA